MATDYLSFVREYEKNRYHGNFEQYYAAVLKFINEVLKPMKIRISALVRCKRISIEKLLEQNIHNEYIVTTKYEDICKLLHIQPLESTDQEEFIIDIMKQLVNTIGYKLCKTKEFICIKKD